MGKPSWIIMVFSDMDEVIVDCSSLVTSLDSLSNIYQLEIPIICDELINIDLESLPSNNIDEYFINSYFVEKFRITPKKIDKIYWFHFTRTIDINSFIAKGILPMDCSLQLLRNICYEIFLEINYKNRDIDKESWDRKWNNAINKLGENDKSKFWAKDYGPDGMFVKEAGLFPKECGTGNFYECPEILRGIFGSLYKLYRIDLYGEFIKRTTPYIITFESEAGIKKPEAVLNNLLLYTYNKLNNVWPQNNDCYDGKGNKVIKENIIRIEEIVFEDTIKISLKEIY